jgi:hypothetical protein
MIRLKDRSLGGINPDNLIFVKVNLNIVEYQVIPSPKVHG